MAQVDDEGRPEDESDGEPGLEHGAEPQGAVKPEPPYQALFPNLDRVSRSSFDKGTVSRRRINRALVVLAVVAVVVVLAVILIPLLTR